MEVILILIGLAILVLGRQFFWIFVSGIGFVAGLVIAQNYLENQPIWFVFGFAALLGIIGVLLAYTLERLAAGAAGFVAGWYLTG